jgi:hypothetical protein
VGVGPPGRCECLWLGGLWLGRQPSHPRGPPLLFLACTSPRGWQHLGHVQTYHFIFHQRPPSSESREPLAFRDPLSSFYVWSCVLGDFLGRCASVTLCYFSVGSPSSCLTSSSRCRTRSFKFRVTTLVFDSMWSDTRLSDFSL